MIKLSMHKASQADGGVCAVSSFKWTLHAVNGGGDFVPCGDSVTSAGAIFIAGRRFYSRRKVAGGGHRKGAEVLHDTGGCGCSVQPKSAGLLAGVSRACSSVAVGCCVSAAVHNEDNAI